MGLRGDGPGFLRLKKELRKEKAKIPWKHIKDPFCDGPRQWRIYMGLSGDAMPVGFTQLKKELTRKNKNTLKTHKISFL